MKVLPRLIQLILLASVCALLHGWFLERPDLDASEDPWGLTVEEALMREPVIWVDGRSELVYSEKHYSGAIHLTLDEWDVGLSELLQAWDPEMTIIVYCDGGGCESSRTMATRLREELGVETVYWLIGGWDVLDPEESGL